MTKLYPDLCDNKVCFKGTAPYCVNFNQRSIKSVKKNNSECEAVNENLVQMN